MSRIRPVMLDALRVARGGRLYPDANGTLRVGFGQVKGYAPRNAVWYAPQTDVRGVVEKETGEEPFNSPARLLERAKTQRVRTVRRSGAEDAAGRVHLHERRHQRQLRLRDAQRVGRAVRPGVRLELGRRRLRLPGRGRHHPHDPRRLALHALGDGRRRRRGQPPAEMGIEPQL